MGARLAIAATLICLLMLFATGQPLPTNETPSDYKTRCGWFDNPTPSNIWLHDREAEWTIGVQGGYQTPGDWSWPEFKPGQWVITNPGGEHGYGCVCMQLRVNKRTHQVIEIKSVRGRSLAQCRRDPALKRWRRMFK
jgi:hypothetical protein